MSDLIELSNARKTYKRGNEIVCAVDDVTLTVPEGDFVALVGPSGSGKTTLLNLIGCLDTPDAGVVRLEGQETGGLRERELTKIRSLKIGFVFQQFFLLPTLTALENVQLPAIFLRRNDREKHAAELLDRVHLGTRAYHHPKQLSGGEMQRVAIARALINGPKILLADEPTGNLDSRNAEMIMQIFLDLNHDGLTIVMVTHNTELARRAGRVVHLVDGRVVVAE